MSCQEIVEFLDAYEDKELDVVTSSQFDRHLLECVTCRARRDQYQQLRGAVRVHLNYYQAPEGFEQRLRERLDLPSRRRDRWSLRDWLPRPAAWAMAAGVTAVLLVSILLLQTSLRPSRVDLLAKEVVSSHIRSLLANHLSDVASTDQHTVKPWFSGKIDFAPQVKDLSTQGFTLWGGRLDYLEERPVAALIYKRRQHAINLFQWPSPAFDSGPKTLSVRGYNVVHWTRSHMDYWAVSDLNQAELSEFVSDLKG